MAMERSAANIMAAGKWRKVGLWGLGVFLLLNFVIMFWASRRKMR